MLSVDQLCVSFGGVRAVDGISLDVRRGSTVGLIGPNGSGKSTFLNGVCGLVPAAGAVEVDGRTVPLGHPQAVRRHGILRSFQTPQVAEELTCQENVLLADRDRALTGAVGAFLARPWMTGRERVRWSRARDALASVGLADNADREAGLLTFGQRRMLELARVLAAQPSFVLLDEPTAGLNDAETDEFGQLLQTVFDDVVGILVVDHKVDFIDALCDELVVLELGQVIASGAPEDVWGDRRVVDAYLGVDDALR